MFLFSLNTFSGANFSPCHHDIWLQVADKYPFLNVHFFNSEDDHILKIIRVWPMRFVSIIQTHFAKLSLTNSNTFFVLTLSVVSDITWRVSVRLCVCFYVSACLLELSVWLSVCFSEEYVLFSMLPTSTTSAESIRWFAALTYYISNLIQTLILQRGAEFHHRKQDKPKK